MWNLNYDTNELIYKQKQFTEYTQCVVPVRLQTLSILKNRNESKYNSHLAMECTQPTRDMSVQAEGITPRLSSTGSPFVPELCLCWNKGAETGCESKGAQSTDSGGVAGPCRKRPDPVQVWSHHDSQCDFGQIAQPLCATFFFFFAEYPTTYSVRLLWGESNGLRLNAVLSTQQVTDGWLWEWLGSTHIPLPPAPRDVMSKMGWKREDVGKTTHRAERCYSDSFLCSQPVQLHI